MCLSVYISVCVAVFCGRAAAARCRNKKKLWMSSLEQKADVMSASNSALQAS